MGGAASRAGQPEPGARACGAEGVGGGTLNTMNIPFLDNWRRDARRRRSAREPASAWADPEGVGQLLAECELLRALADNAGIDLGDSPDSLEALDQLLPRWREDPEELPRLGNDAGLYLGTVVVRTVPGARWSPGPDGRPVVVLASGREVDVVSAGQGWAATGTPELSQAYNEIAET